MKTTLVNSQQGADWMRQAWSKMKPYLESGGRLTVEIKRENRSLEQNAMYHSIIHQIAKQARHLGATWDAESWKRLLVDAFYAEKGQNIGKVVPNLTGDGIVQLGLQTRNFTKAEASEFTEFCMAWAAQNGVTIYES